MDPDATLADMQWFLIEGDKTGALERAAALYGWLGKGGFEPNWSKANQTTLAFWLSYTSARIKDQK